MPAIRAAPKPNMVKITRSSRCSKLLNLYSRLPTRVSRLATLPSSWPRVRDMSSALAVVIYGLSVGGVVVESGVD